MFDERNVQIILGFMIDCKVNISKVRIGKRWLNFLLINQLDDPLVNWIKKLFKELSLERIFLNSKVII